MRKGEAGPGPRHWGVLALALVSGCILTGAPDDLAIVCERKTGSPWHPYAPDEVKAMTLIEPGATAAGVDDATKAAADRVLTLGASPYAQFEGHLFPTGDRGGDGRTWRFDANGTADDGTVDRYQFGLRGSEGTLVPLPTAIDAPFRIEAVATEIVRQDAEALALTNGTPVGFSSWSEGRPSCVELRYDSGAVLTVNVVQQRVVHAG